MRHASSLRQRGFSILEILITVVVLGGGLLAIGNLYGKVMNGSAAAKQRSEAVVLAEKKLDDLRYTAYASIAAGSDTVSAASGSGSSYNRSWTVTPSTSPAYKDVAVTVSWTDSRNQSQSAVLTSRISGIDPTKSAALIAVTTSSTTSTSTSSTSSTTSSSSSTSTTSSSSTTTSTASTTTTTQAATTTTTTSTTTTTTTTAASCSTTVSGNLHNNWDTVTSSPSGSCTTTKTTYSCTVTAAKNSAITIVDLHNNSTYSATTSANCGNQSNINPQ